MLTGGEAARKEFVPAGGEYQESGLLDNDKLVWCCCQQRLCHSMWLFLFCSAVKIRPFFQLSPWRDPRLRPFIGYFFGASRNKTSTVSYGTAIAMPSKQKTSGDDPSEEHPPTVVFPKLPGSGGRLSPRRSLRRSLSGCRAAPCAYFFPKPGMANLRSSFWRNHVAKETRTR